MQTFATRLAREAGALLREGSTRPRQIERKGPFDLVTDIDRASEALIVTAIRKQFPDHSILAEEGGGVTHESAWTWVIDPLDGTNNYAHNFPFYCVSLGLLHNNLPYAGVIYDPVRDELFAAERGHGATLNGMPIQVSRAATLTDSLLSTGFPYDFATNSLNNAAEFARVHQYVQGIRRSGSAALDLAYVACGRLEGHWEFWLKPWDSTAAAIILVEAGGMISERDGGDWQPFATSMVATNGGIHGELLGILQER